MSRVLYICNKLNPRCHEDGRTCYEECYLTSNPDYAVNGAVSDPENYPERFFEIQSDFADYEERKGYDKKRNYL